MRLELSLSSAWPKALRRNICPLAARSHYGPGYKEWYKQKAKSARPESIAADLDILEEPAKELRIYPSFTDANIVDVDPSELGIVEAIAGIDWGFFSPSAVVIVGIDSQANYYVLEEFNRSELAPLIKDSQGQILDSLFKVCVELQARYAVSNFFCGPDQPGLAKLFQNEGLYVTPTTKSLSDGISRVRLLLDSKPPRLFVHRSCTNLIAQFKKYRKHRTRAGVYDKEPAPGAFDVLDALRYAIVGATDVDLGWISSW